MKKVLSFVLVLALVLGSFSMAFAATPTDVVGTDYEVAVAALTELGVVDGYTDGTYKPENAVNRAEAAKLVITALGLGAYASGNTASFTDLEGFGWATGYIGYAEALGILKGDGNGKFRPADTVSYQEMATMLVRAVGYTDASLPGTWPANYVVRAKALGIMDGVDKVGNTAANRGDVAVLLYNTLDCTLGYIDMDNNWQPNKDAQGNATDSMLARLSLNVNTTLAGDEIKVVLTDRSNYAKDVNLSEYYGAYVVPFRTNDSDNDITGIKEIKSTFLTGKFVTGAAASATNLEKVVFVADDVKYDLAYETPAYNYWTLSNNRQVGGTSAAITSSTAVSGEVTIAAKVSGLTIKNIYSIASWGGATHVIWTESLDAQLERKDVIAGKDFSMTDNKEIDTTSFALLGVDKLEDIAVGDVVSVYTDGTYVTKVEVSNKTVEGIVSKVSTDAAPDTKYTIDGKAYKLAGATGGSTTDVKLGAEGTYYLTYGGRIVDFEGVTTLDDYAVVYKTAGPDVATGAYDSTTSYAVKLITADGKISQYVIDAGTIVTGAGAGLTAANACITNSAAQAAVTEGTIIAYNLNKDGEIDEILIPTQDDATGGALTAKGFLDGYEVADNVVVFSGYGDSRTTSQSKLSVGSLSDIAVNETLTTATKYILVDKKVVAILYNDATPENTYGVVESYAKVKNSDNKTVYEVNMLVDGAKVTYLTDKEAFTGVSDLTTTANATSLFAITLTNGEMTAIEATTAAVSTSGAVANIKGHSISITNAGVSASPFMELSDSVVVYEITYTLTGAYDTMVISDLGSIFAGDTVYLYETNSKDGHEGYDVIIFKAN